MSLLDTRRRIKSVKNTQKITRAMQMVSASKMKKAIDAALAGRPYAVELEQLIENLVAHAGENSAQHPFFLRREQPKKIAFLIYTADRGLCGAFNSNILRYISRKELAPGQEKIRVAIGRKGMQFFKSFHQGVVAEFDGLTDKPKFLDTIPVTRIAIDGFMNGEFDEVRIVYNHFVNTMTQVVTEKVLLPLKAPEAHTRAEKKNVKVDYIYEPNAQEVLNRVLPRYLETIVYQSQLESNASEQSARMVAMKSATDNAKELIDMLTLDYNKARQANITKEILEIVGGAEALAEA